MSLIEKYASSGEKLRVADGTYPARIVEIFDIGRQKGSYEGVDYNKATLWISFEFPTEKHDFKGEMKPLRLSGEFTKSTNEKSKLYKIIKAINPSVESFEELLGGACLVEVGSTKGGNAKFMSAVGMPNGLQVEQLTVPPTFYDIAKPNVDIFNTFPDFLKEKMMNSDDWKEPSATGITKDNAFDETPF